MVFQNPAPNAQNRILKILHQVLPIRLQHNLRDQNGFKNVSDVSCTILGGIFAVCSPNIAPKFIRISRSLKTYQYGTDARQYVEFMEGLPTSKKDGSAPVMVFVHGGAWGSGKPWMYRLAGQGLMDLGFRVILIGYRVYPQASTEEQIADISLALEWISKNRMELGLEEDARFFVGGHSSGAHILATYLLQAALGSKAPPLPISGFVGLSGVYCIYKHYLFEKARGVHEVSPMKPANGGLREFEMNSPTKLAWKLTKDQAKTLPSFLLIHATDDETVPMISSCELAEALGSKSVLKWLHAGDHFGPVGDLMFGQGKSSTENHIQEYMRIVMSDTSEVDGSQTQMLDSSSIKSNIASRL